MKNTYILTILALTVASCSLFNQQTVQAMRRDSVTEVTEETPITKRGIVEPVRREEVTTTRKVTGPVGSVATDDVEGPGRVVTRRTYDKRYDSYDRPYRRYSYARPYRRDYYGRPYRRYYDGRYRRYRRDYYDDRAGNVLGGAATGALIGGVAGGGRGAAIGAGVGAGLGLVP